MKVVGLDSLPHNGIYRIATVALLAALLTGVGVWLKLGADAVTRTDVSAMIATESPYVEDRGVISALGVTVSELTKTVDELKVQVAELMVLMERRGR